MNDSVFGLRPVISSLCAWIDQRAKLIGVLKQHVEKPTCAHFLLQLGPPVAFDSILRFLLDDMCK